jgi:hypothetical protein
MANAKDSGNNKLYATVDTDPEAGGFFTDILDPRELMKTNKVSKVFFSIREAGDTQSVDASVITVVLQFKCDGDDRWQTYVPLDGSSLAIGNRIALEDFGANVKWRAGVEDDGYTSGSVTFGFDW